MQTRTPRPYLPRDRETVRRERETRNIVKAAGRAVRRRMEADAHDARKIAARETGCVIDVDPTTEGDFGDGSGYEIRPRNAMRALDVHADHVQAFYDAAATGN